MSGRWKAIASGRKWTPPDKKGEESRPLPNRTLHIECARSDKGKLVAFLEALYNTFFKREYPMGVKLRFIGLIRDATGLAMRQQCEHLHARQKSFNEILESRPVFALQDAYTFDTRARETL
jgi:hypothetical protein